MSKLYGGLIKANGNMGKLDEKVVIVTGGGVGIGEGYSLGLAREGARVVVADIEFKAAREIAQEIKSSGGEALAVDADVSDEKSMVNMAKKAHDEFGRIDVLVNNAALLTAIKPKPWDRLTVGEWDRLMAVNLRGPWLCARAVFPYMKMQGKGKIINIASTTIFGGYKGGPIHYVTSKGGVLALTRFLARELGEYKINVNTIAPGFVTTDNTKRIFDGDERAALAEERCLKREETPDDLTGTVVFLASDDSDFITGQILVVDGGDVFY